MYSTFLSRGQEKWFELSSDFCEKVLMKVQREFKNSSSYWKFELSGVRIIGSVLVTFYLDILNFPSQYQLSRV